MIVLVDYIAAYQQDLANYKLMTIIAAINYDE